MIIAHMISKSAVQYMEHFIYHFKAFSPVGTRLWNELPARMRSLPMKTFKNELHNLLLLVLEQCDDYLDTDQITFALKKSDHMKRWL